MCAVRICCSVYVTSTHESVCVCQLTIEGVTERQEHAEVSLNQADEGRDVLVRISIQWFGGVKVVRVGAIV